jgi:hypothetical protein
MSNLHQGQYISVLESNGGPRFVVGFVFLNLQCVMFCISLFILFILYFLTIVLSTLSRLITGFVTRLTRWVPLVEQELLILPEHLSSLPGF